MPVWPQEAKDYICPDPNRPGLSSELKASGKKIAGDVMRGIVQRYDGKYGAVLPTPEKPLLVHKLNKFGTRGGINTLKTSVKRNDWLPHLCTSRAQIIGLQPCLKTNVPIVLLRCTCTRSNAC